MERPAPDPKKLLEAWMEWERGDAMPGRTLSNLKTGGMRDLLEQLAADEESQPAAADAANWTPVV